MPDYGKTSAGASWQTVEVRQLGRKVTIPAGEPVVSMTARLRSQGSATQGWKLALYNGTTDALVTESAAQAGFTDTTGAARTAAVTLSAQGGSVDYWANVTGEAVAGGGNTIECGYDAVSSNTALYQYWFISATFPTLDADLTGAEVPGGTHNADIYVTTTAGGSGNANLLAGKFGGLLRGKI